MDRKKGSGCLVTTTTDENMEVVEDLNCSQEENPAHMIPREKSERNNGSADHLLRTTFWGHRKMLKYFGIKVAEDRLAKVGVSNNGLELRYDFFGSPGIS